MHLWKRETLDHCSVAELIVKATPIAKAKARRHPIQAARDIAWFAIANKPDLITYIANEGEGAGERVVKTRDIPHWGKK